MNFQEYIVNPETSIREAVTKMDKGGEGFLAICQGEKLVAILTDGDFRRAVLTGVDLSNFVLTISNQKFVFLDTTDKDKIDEVFEKIPINHLPIILEGKLERIVFRHAFYEGSVKSERLFAPAFRDSPVVIMAGGKGTRLKPYTNILPKPLVPVGSKSLVEHILEKFRVYGCSNFYLTLNHKAAIIRAYIEQLPHWRDCVKFVEEEKPLGTAGALHLLKGKLSRSFFLTNCDTLLLADYGTVYKFHISNNHSITIVGAVMNHKVPYGVCEVDKNGGLIQFKEKPETDYIVNTGFYLIEPNVLDLLEPGEVCGMNTLIHKAQESGLTIGVFPVMSHQWKDFGDMVHFQKEIQGFPVERRD